MESWLKLVSIWSVFWVKVGIFEKVPTHFSKCVFLDYRIFDKCDFIYVKMAKNDTFLPKKWQNKIFSKNAAQREIFFNIDQYFLVFWEEVVSIWSVFWERVVGIVVSILAFFYRPLLSSLHYMHFCYHTTLKDKNSSDYNQDRHSPPVLMENVPNSTQSYC